jgi:outer membrane murein-binding lipoprotein Lpp
VNIDFITANLAYIVLVLIVALAYLTYHMLNKEAYSERNIRSVASVVEELNREIYYLKKELSEIQKSLQSDVPRMSDEEVYQEIERSVYDLIRPLSVNVQELHAGINALDEQIDARLASLESGVKQISMPSYVHANDDAKIISLFKQGVSMDTISKELNLSKPEVEFVLKINKIK